MRDNIFKVLLAIFYLIFALMLTFSLWFILVKIGSELFYSLYYSGKFSFSNIEFMKAIKSGIFCGLLAGSGCGCIYYLRYSHRKKRQYIKSRLQCRDLSFTVNYPSQLLANPPYHSAKERPSTFLHPQFIDWSDTQPFQTAFRIQLLLERLSSFWECICTFEIQL